MPWTLRRTAVGSMQGVVPVVGLLPRRYPRDSNALRERSGMKGFGHKGEHAIRHRLHLGETVFHGLLSGDREIPSGRRFNGTIAFWS